MKHLHHTWALVAALLLLLAPGQRLQAQEKTPTSIFSLHAGPSWYVGQLMGITSQENAYCRDLRQGIAWEADYWYTGERPEGKGVKVGPGVLYHGSLYKAATDEGSDKIGMHYLALQLGTFFFQKHYMLQVAAGVGYQFYADKSTVYGKPRNVSMNKLACNLSAAGEYFLNNRWGVSAKVNWLISSSEAYSVEYHGEHWQVDHPHEGEGYFGRLSLLVGLNYHF